MEIERISEDLKFLNQIGQTLSLDERLKLNIALLRLTSNYNFDQVVFWGRIDGTLSNYYVALGLNFQGNFEFPHKKFFWSNNQFEFKEFPLLNPEHASKIDTFRNFFTGQPEKILVQVEGAEEEGAQQPPADQNDNAEEQKGAYNDDSDVEIKPPPKNFTELDRLAFVIHAIEFDCAIAPIGAYKLTPTHELRYNDSFKGLSQSEALNLSEYQHFRAPQSEQKIKQIAKDDALFHFDFLDPIALDQPKGQWSVQADSSKTNITVRNILWPGFIAYHSINSKIFGYAYMGDGIKNVDLAFWL